MSVALLLLGVSSIFWAGRTEASVLVTDMTMSRMVELNAGAPFCDLYSDRGVIQKMVFNADPKKVRQMSSNLVADLEETCKVSRAKGKVRGVYFFSPLREKLIPFKFSEL